MTSQKKPRPCNARGSGSAYALIEAQKVTYPIAVMCRVLGVSRSGWYAWSNRVRPSERDIQEAKLLAQIRQIHAASRGTYRGVWLPRGHVRLVRDRVQVGEERVARLMRQDGLQGRVRRRSSTWRRGRLSAGRWRPTCEPSWWKLRFEMRSALGRPLRGWCTTAIEAPSTRAVLTASCSRCTASNAA